ncbi:MAG: MAPEG family protein [Betaproteobacteria bacterium]
MDADDDLAAMRGHPLGARRARVRYILRSLFPTVLGTHAAIGVLYFWVVPPLAGMDELASRVALALRCGAVAALPYFAVCLVIVLRRLSEGSHDPLAGAESAALRIEARVMQNTLEQLVAFVLAILALATLLAPAQMRLLPIVTGAFVAARLVYWWGYHRGGTLGRAPGVQMTFALNVPLVLGAGALALARGLS